MSQPISVIRQAVRTYIEFEEITMEARLNIYGNDTAMKFSKSLTAAHKPVAGSTPSRRVIHGCSYFTDMHA